MKTWNERRPSQSLSRTGTWRSLTLALSRPTVEHFLWLSDISRYKATKQVSVSIIPYFCGHVCQPFDRHLPTLWTFVCTFNVFPCQYSSFYCDVKINPTFSRCFQAGLTITPHFCRHVCKNGCQFRAALLFSTPNIDLGMPWWVSRPHASWYRRCCDQMASNQQMSSSTSWWSLP